MTLLALVLLAVCHPGWSKGITVRIEITGESLPAVIVITEPEIVERFSIWQGPNSGFVQPDGSLRSSYDRAIADFPAGTIERPPDGVVRYTVRFFIARDRNSESGQIPYEVQYANVPASPGGFMFLPLENRSFIVHGVEGNWLRSTHTWEELVRPVIAEAATVSR